MMIQMIVLQMSTTKKEIKLKTKLKLTLKK